MGQFRVNIKSSIIKQPDKQYVAPDCIGVQFYIDFAKCDPKNITTTNYLRTIVPTEKNVVAVNAVLVWVVAHKELDLKLYSPKQVIAEYIDNMPIPYGVQKKNIMRATKNG